MSQLFSPRSNTIASLCLVGSVVLVCVLGALAYFFQRTSYKTSVDVEKTQPVAFSHKHHVKGVGLDCRYCHTAVEHSAFAGMPTTHTCMTCHSQIWSQSGALKVVRESMQKNIPIQWKRVMELPDYVYFNHSIHVNKGVACETCHGQVQEMPLMRKTKAFHMKQCIECHRSVAKTNYKRAQLTNCSTCHR